MPVETFAAFVGEQILGIAVGAAAVVAAPVVGPKLGGTGHDAVGGAKSAAYSIKEKTGSLLSSTTSTGEAAINRMRGWVPGTRTAAQADEASLASDTTALATNVAPTSGRGVTDTLIEGTHWYGEQWSDLLHEAHAMAHDNERASLASTLSALPEAKVVHSIPGRVRFQLPQMKGNKSLAEAVAGDIAAVGGIKRVQASATTGSLLVQYDATQYDSVESLLRRILN